MPFPSRRPTEVTPTLSPVERKAFSELASRLTARLRGGRDAIQNDAGAAAPAPPAETQPPEMPRELPPAAAPVERTAPRREPAAAPRAEVAASDQRPILDRLPVGVLVYRLDKLIYANRAFLDWTGYGAAARAGRGRRPRRAVRRADGGRARRRTTARNR